MSSSNDDTTTSTMTTNVLDISNNNYAKLTPELVQQALNDLLLRHRNNHLNDHDDDDDDGDPQELIASIEIILADNNSLVKLESLDRFVNLRKLSLANNRLVEIRQISKFSRLECLNLPRNSLTSLDNFKQLPFLRWLNIAGNQIKDLSGLKFNTSLTFVDASNNSIDDLCDLTPLKSLETLNLTGNELISLRDIHKRLPALSLRHLYLSSNAIEDLNEVCYLEAFENLESLSLANNPCVAFSLDPSNNTEIIIFNYRPFVINWCFTLRHIDGIQVTEKELLKAEWLYSQGKGRKFVPGQQAALVEYLIKQNPILSNESINEEIRLSNVLEKKEAYSGGSEKKARSKSPVIRSPAKVVLGARQPSPGLPDRRNVLEDVQFSSNEAIPSLVNNNPESKENRYVDYDNRPIKPLDTNTLYQQLAEYKEVTPEELEDLKQKLVLKAQAKSQQQEERKRVSVGVKSRVQSKPTVSKMKTPVRQLSSNQSKLNSASPKQPTSRTTVVLNRSNSSGVAKKTPTIKSTTPKTKTSSAAAAAAPKTSQSSPGKANSSLKKQISETKPINFKKFVLNPKAEIKKSVVAAPVQTLSPTKRETTPTRGRLPHRRANNNDVSSETDTEANKDKRSGAESSSPFGKSPSSQQNHLRRSGSLNSHTLNPADNESLIHQLEEIKNKRNEKRLARQKCWEDIKHEARMLEEKKEAASLLWLENMHPVVVPPKEQLTFEDKCAIKIQAAWRGYYWRKSKLLKPAVLHLKQRRVLSQLKTIQSNFEDLRVDQKELEVFVKDSVSNILLMLQLLKKAYANKRVEDEAFELACQIQHPLIDERKITNTRKDSDENPSELVDHLNKENLYLKSKCKQLEERCRNLEKKFNTSGDNTKISADFVSEQPQQRKLEPQPEVYPPLKVRLQKLNEKSVALKWNHNPKNSLVDLSGYNVYINDDLLATMSPFDKLASIDGMRDEGEYRIYMTAVVCERVESEPSTVVITRVRRKQQQQQQQQQQPQLQKEPSVSPIKKRQSSRETVASRFFKEFDASVENLSSKMDTETVSMVKQTLTAHTSGSETMAETIKFSTSEPNLTKSHHHRDPSGSPLRQSIALSDDI